MATSITLELPEEIARRLATKWKDLPRAALESLVADGYRSELLSADQVRALLGFGSRIRLDKFLKHHGVYDYTIDDYEADLATLRAGRTKHRRRH
jgi:hypothetical protein